MGSSLSFVEPLYTHTKCMHPEVELDFTEGERSSFCLSDDGQSSTQKTTEFDVGLDQSNAEILQLTPVTSDTVHVSADAQLLQQLRLNNQKKKQIESFSELDQLDAEKLQHTLCDSADVY